MKFMAMFDANGKAAPSMFPEDAKTYITAYTSEHAPTEIAYGKNTNLSTEEALRKAFLRKRNLLRQEFEKYDSFNTGNLSLDGLYTILEKVQAKPLPTRAELRKLWKSSKNNFIKNANETVNFMELERWAECADGGKMGRHVLPRIPVVGDDDYRINSKTLSNDLHLLETQVNMATQNQIDWVRVQLRF